MNFSIKNMSEMEVKSDALILPIFEDFKTDIYSELDGIAGGLIKKIYGSDEFSGKLNQTLLIHVKNINSSRIVLAGLGKKNEISNEKLRQCSGKAFSLLKAIGVKDAAVSTKAFSYIAASMKGDMKPVEYFIEGGLLSLYSFEMYRKSERKTELKDITILSGDKDVSLSRIQTIVDAVNYARDLINMPSNHMTPSSLASEALKLSGKKVRVNILDKKACEKEGMQSYLSVAKGSAEPLKFIIIQYNGGKGKSIVLIGKSITFDSGGISIKPAEGMEKMKYDMSGGAAVLAAIMAAAKLKLPVNVIGILPAAENMPGATATRPGDIVKAITGKTIEINNTDAEGRLALADAIGYAIKHYSPKEIIDIATLTGACSIALGNEAIAMMGNNEGLMDKLKAASEETYERVWQMPLYDEYKEYIKGDAADIKNSGGRNGSLVTGGYFLKEFAGDTPWAHLDIAGTAWNDKDKPYMAKGASGVGVRLLLQYLQRSV
jgi:leucyl aminopeptidase